MEDKINPNHYKTQTSLECIDVMELVFGSDVAIFCLLNAWKYIWRWKNKNGEEDLKKAAWYLAHIDKYDPAFPAQYVAIAQRMEEYISDRGL